MRFHVIASFGDMGYRPHAFIVEAPDAKAARKAAKAKSPGAVRYAISPLPAPK